MENILKVASKFLVVVIYHLRALINLPQPLHPLFKDLCLDKGSKNSKRRDFH
jgi:hypothetical protein